MGLSRPTVDDLVGWLKLQSDPDSPTLAVYNECFTAAIDDIESRVSSDFVIADGFSLVEGDDNYPPRVRTAVLIKAARLAKRSTSPEGVAGMSEYGVVIRIMSNDPDIEGLITRYKKLDGFA